MPVTVKPYLKRKPSGDSEYAEPKEYKCYRVDEIKAITDKTNKESTFR